MKKVALILIVFVLLAGIVIFYFFFFQKKEEKPAKLKPPELNKKQNMKLVSPVFKNNQFIPLKYTCDGENVNPPLEISEVPKEAQSLVLIVDDPDAIIPAGKVWDHWLVWNIAPSTSLIKEDNVPEGAAVGLNSGKNQSYDGPCPPDKTHRYFFKLYALDVKLNISEFSEKKALEEGMKGHILKQTELVGLYQR